MGPDDDELEFAYEGKEVRLGQPKPIGVITHIRAETETIYSLGSAQGQTVDVGVSVQIQAYSRADAERMLAALVLAWGADRPRSVDPEELRKENRRLLALCESMAIDPNGTVPGSISTRALNALEGVRRLHHIREGRCAHDGKVWPCPTIAMAGVESL